MKLSRTLEIKIGPNNYTIEFPNVGKMMDIELLKLQLTGDKYEQLKFSFNPAFKLQALNAEAIATFNVLIPQLKKDLTVTSMLDLNIEQFQEIVDAYVTTYLPWYEEWMAKLSNPKGSAQPTSNA